MSSGASLETVDGQKSAADGSPGENMKPTSGLAWISFFLVGSLAVAHADAAGPTTALPNVSMREGQHDFDFEIGTWKTHLRRLVHPLTGSSQWVEFDGTSVVRKIWEGRANLVELEVDGPGGHIEGL